MFVIPVVEIQGVIHISLPSRPSTSQSNSADFGLVHNFYYKIWTVFLRVTIRCSAKCATGPHSRFLMESESFIYNFQLFVLYIFVFHVLCCVLVCSCEFFPSYLNRLLCIHCILTLFIIWKQNHRWYTNQFKVIKNINKKQSTLHLVSYCREWTDSVSWLYKPFILEATEAILIMLPFFASRICKHE